MNSRIFCFVGTQKCFVSFFVSIVSVFVYDPKKNVWMEFIHFHSIFMEWKWLKATQSDNGIFFYICSNKLRLSFFFLSRCLTTFTCNLYQWWSTKWSWWWWANNVIFFSYFVFSVMIVFCVCHRFRNDKKNCFFLVGIFKKRAPNWNIFIHSINH